MSKGLESFANQLIFDWDMAMDRFFTAVEKKARTEGLSTEEVSEALDRGYGLEVADAWNEWMDES